MKKQLKTLLLALALCAALLPVRAEAAGASLSGSGSVQPGSDVTLTLSVSGSNVMGVEANLSYDSAVLEYKSYSKLQSNWEVLADGGKFVMYGVSSPINSSTGLVSVTFRVKSGLDVGAALSASFQNVLVSDGNSEESVGTVSWSGAVAAAPSGNCAISSIICSNAKLSPEFTSSNTYYTATVPFDVTSLDLTCKTADSGAHTSITGNNLVVGENTVTITCTAPNGAVKYYTIVVTRQQDPNYKASTNALLSELTLDAGRLSPAFSSAITEYVAYVPYETKLVTLSGVAKDEKAAPVGEVKRQITAEGDNLLAITCTAEDGITTKTYTVHVFRMPKYEGVLPTVEVIDPNAEPEIPVHEIPMVTNVPLLGEMPTLTVAIAALALVVLLLFLLGFLIGRVSKRGNGGGPAYERVPDRPFPPAPPVVPYDGDEDDEDDDADYEPDYPEVEEPASRPADDDFAIEDVLAEISRQTAPAAPAASEPTPAPQRTAPAVPVVKIVSDVNAEENGPDSPFVEDLSDAVSRELEHRRVAAEAAEAAEAAINEAMSAESERPTDESLDDIALNELLKDIHNM